MAAAVLEPEAVTLVYPSWFGTVSGVRIDNSGIEAFCKLYYSSSPEIKYATQLARHALHEFESKNTLNSLRL